MNKIILVAGSPNTGKTTTTNTLIAKLINDGYNIDELANDYRFWGKTGKSGENNYSGDVILSKGGKKILIVSYGDTIYWLDKILTEENLKKVDTVVCCSHATRGKTIFNYFNNLTEKWGKEGVKVIPLFKNLLSHSEIKDVENDLFAELIKDLL